MNDKPQIFSFYSFKGGVGRTMTLTNLAYSLAMQGRHVLIVDMDLEAPGLSISMTRSNPPELPEPAKKDVIDLLLWAKNIAPSLSEESPLDPAELPPATDYISHVPVERLSIPDRDSYLIPGHLDVIAINDRRDFYERTAELGIVDFTRQMLIDVGSLLRGWFQTQRVVVNFPDYYGDVPEDERVVPYDYVFVDSRTGITEVGGLCVGPMSDQLVVLCGLNDQNIEGTRMFLEQVGVLAPTTDSLPKVIKPTLFVASPLSEGDLDIKRERLARFEKCFGKPDGRISYHPRLGLIETIFIRDFPYEHIADDYRRLLLRLRRDERDSGSVDFPGLFEATLKKDPVARMTHGRAIMRVAINAQDIQLLSLAFSNFDLDALDSESDFRLVDQAFRVLAAMSENPHFEFLRQWAYFMATWGKKTFPTSLKLCRIDWGLHCSDHALGLPNLSPRSKAQALNSRGVLLGERGQLDPAIKVYDSVVSMEDAPNPQKANAFVNRSWMNFKSGQLSDAINDAQRAIELGSDTVAAYCNLAIGYLADSQTDAALNVYREALQRATTDDIGELLRVLDEAVAKYGELPGAGEVRGMIAARKDELVGGPGGDGMNV